MSNDKEWKRGPGRGTVTVLSIALIAALAWGYYGFRLDYQDKIEEKNQHMQAFIDLLGGLQDIESSMAKAAVAESAPQQVMYFSEIAQDAEKALTDISSFPSEEYGVSGVAALLNQTGDFGRVVARTAAAGNDITESDRETLTALHEQTTMVSRGLQEIYSSVMNESLVWVDKGKSIWQRMGFYPPQTASAADEQSSADEAAGPEVSEESPVAIPVTAEGGEQPEQATQELEDKIFAEPAGSVSSGLKQLDSSLQKYPPFSCEGELDAHYVDSPLGLPASPEVDEQQAETVAATFLKSIGYQGSEQPKVVSTTEGPMGGYLLQADDSTYIQVARRGGVVISYNKEREIGERTIEGDAIQRQVIQRFRQMGFQTEVETIDDNGSYFHIDLVPVIDMVRLYPDKIRVGVAADNGEIIKYDASPYYAFHHERSLERSISQEEAETQLRDGFQVEESRIAYIALVGKQEALCYEFQGIYQGEEYLVYISAQDGIEKKIGRVLNTPGGKKIE